MSGDAPTIVPIAADRAPLLARRFLGTGGSALAATFAHVPELLEAVMPFIAVVLGPSHLGERLKHIVIYRTSVLSACRYCTRLYSDGDDARVNAAEIAALTQPDADVPCTFDARERAAIAFVAAFHREPATSVAPLRAEFRDDEIVALATIVGATLFLNRFSIAMGLT